MLLKTRTPRLLYAIKVI